MGRHAVPIEHYSDRLNRVADYVDTHIASPIALSELARLAAFSLNHFRRIFSEWAGESPGDYVLHRRLDVSAALLTYMPGLPVGEIARRCGFNSAESYSRAFRQHFRMTPSEWRGGGHVRWDALLNPQPAVPHLLWDVQVKEMARTRVLYLRKIGSYYDQDKEYWLRLWTLVLQLGLGKPRLYGSGLDNPAVTPPARCRFDLCAEIPESLALPPEVSSKYIGGGLYAIVNFAGPKSEMEGHWRWMLNDWLPHSGFHYGQGACIERHLTYPSEMDLVNCELCVPLERHS